MFIKMFGESFEKAIIDFLNIDGDRARKLKGRGNTFVKQQTFRDDMKFDFTNGTSDSKSVAAKCYQLKAQALRALHWSERIIVEQRGHLPPAQKQAFAQHNLAAWTALSDQFDQQDDLDMEMQGHLKEELTPHHLAVKLKMYHNKKQAQWEEKLKEGRKVEQRATRSESQKINWDGTSTNH